MSRSLPDHFTTEKPFTVRGSLRYGRAREIVSVAWTRTEVRKSNLVSRVRTGPKHLCTTDGRHRSIGGLGEERTKVRPHTSPYSLPGLSTGEPGNRPLEVTRFRNTKTSASTDSVRRGRRSRKVPRRLGCIWMGTARGLSRGMGKESTWQTRTFSECVQPKPKTKLYLWCSEYGTYTHQSNGHYPWDLDGFPDIGERLDHNERKQSEGSRHGSSDRSHSTMSLRLLTSERIGEISNFCFSTQRRNPPSFGVRIKGTTLKTTTGRPSSTFLVRLLQARRRL